MLHDLVILIDFSMELSLVAAGLGIKLSDNRNGRQLQIAGSQFSKQHMYRMIKARQNPTPDYETLSVSVCGIPSVDTIPDQTILLVPDSLVDSLLTRYPITPFCRFPILW